jgi:hypothetical protein
VAVAATGIAVSSGIVLHGSDSGGAASAALASSSLGSADDVRTSRTDVAEIAGRSAQVSRSDRRTAVDATKARALSQESGGQRTATEDLTDRDPRTVARAMLGQFGFGSEQFSCLDALYVSESGWDVHADNPGSSAYGIPQALPGSKMSSAGPDWQNSAETQIRWGLGYIRDRYGSACAAWSYKQGHQWY